MQRVGYRAGKSPVCVKKSKIAQNFYMTLGTDVITIFLKSPSKNGCRNMCHTLIFVINKTKKPSVRPAFTWPKSGNLIPNSAANIWELITWLEQTTGLVINSDILI